MDYISKYQNGQLVWVPYLPTKKKKPYNKAQAINRGSGSYPKRKIKKRTSGRSNKARAHFKPSVLQWLFIISVGVLVFWSLLPTYK